MAVQDKLSFGSIVSLDVYPSQILGSNFTDVKVLGIFDRTTANLMTDVDGLHANVYPFLPNGSPENAGDYQYVKLQHLNGSISIIGLPWIIEESISVSNKGKLTIVIDDITIDDREKIITAINAVGYRVNSVDLS